jgi:hypothetical protein
MGDWKELSVEDQILIQDNLMRAFNHLGIKGAMTRWDKPSHWRLSIQTSWCAGKTHPSITRVLEQAIARASIQAPKGGIILCDDPEK